MRTVDLFCGCGGMSLGFQMSGHQIVGAFDCWQPALDCYAANMLNQAFSDRAKLSKLLNISDEQMSYVTNADSGCGLIKYGPALVPFINRFPKDTELYRLMTTRPGEGVFGSGNAS